MKSCSGFTLIELLVSMGMIAVLAAIVISAINPAKQLADARNIQRRSDVRAILEAINQQAITNGGILTTEVDSSWRMLGTAVSGCAVTCGTGGGGTVTLEPNADSTLRQDQSSTNYGSSDQIEEYPWSPSWTRRAILTFDLTSIPIGATVSTATLSLLEKQAYGVGTQNVAAHRVTDNWNENTVTWGNTASDFAATATDTIAITWTGTTKRDNWNVLSDVQAFVSGSQTNYGWMIKDAIENSSQAYWFFHSREAAISGNRPSLTVQYTSSGGGGGVTADACLDLSAILAPTYLIAVPTDPTTGSNAETFYAVREGSDGRLSVRSCSAEQGEDIAVTM